MSISKEKVEHVAKLARIYLTSEEAELYTGQLNDILGFAEKLNQLDTTNVEPTSHVLPMANVLRQDERKSSLDRGKALANAPEQKDGMFKVPAVFEE
ncbi:aspartyl/glutamyl-tRNA(Asn/Gln) amidotransferase subunit C [Marininema mesophilum]|uniref:Aspartyl/glutamyl-tRNA(Asn/Gln) amidotransferase subunit C n=1 Tax=Marininema mesophilum TaxID=1048340 RepID=A0A1H2WB66_9BACL|nr:Asp-tRNA(Asn)/Glu-tRNA(Gln) amidotransferase subunit GatC [Marininema mesophilum]SDW77726.1 aspartyl/glutamyl-tRNA(Asn/Gln) amidotransferase subunit C [Marininema mesophilum]